MGTELEVKLGVGVSVGVSGEGGGSWQAHPKTKLNSEVATPSWLMSGVNSLMYS